MAVSLVKIIQFRCYENKIWMRSIDGTITLEENEVLGENLVLPSFCPQQILEVLTRRRAPASALRSFFFGSE
jgi:hypothetical protein